jgi:hypothetical protein
MQIKFEDQYSVHTCAHQSRQGEKNSSMDGWKVVNRCVLLVNG